MIEAATDLASTDDVEFARRCGDMTTTGDDALLVELAGQLERLAECLAGMSDTLDLTAERIRDALFARA